MKNIKKEKVSQVYIDPFYVKGNMFKTYLWWDWKTKLEVQVVFVNKKSVLMDRFRIIGFMTELMRRSDINLTLTREQFINIHFKEFPGLKIDITKIDF